MKFNEEKLRRMLFIADQLHAAVSSAQDAYIEAKGAREHYEIVLRNKLRDPLDAETTTLGHLKTEEMRHMGERDVAVEKWRQARRVADSCERYAREVLGWASERPGTLHGVISHITGGALR